MNGLVRLCSLLSVSANKSAITRETGGGRISQLLISRYEYRVM